MARGEEERRGMAEEAERRDKLNKTYEEENKALRKEMKKRRKMLTAQQECIFKGTDLREFQKCSHCPKTFVNQSFLTSHLARRHRLVRQEEGQEQGELRSHVKTEQEKLSGGSEVRMEELTRLLTRQQEQIQSLQETLKERLQEREEMEVKRGRGEVEGRMEAQERFWQAQVRTLGERLREEVEAARSREEGFRLQLQEEKEKRKEVRQKRRSRRRERRQRQEETKPDVKLEQEVMTTSPEAAELKDLKTVVISAEETEESPQFDRRQEKRKSPIKQLMKKKPDGVATKSKTAVETEDRTKSLEKAWASTEETRVMVQLERGRRTGQEETEVMGVTDSESGEESEEEEEEDVPGMRPAVSGFSLKSDHVYEAPQSIEDLSLGEGGGERLERCRDVVHRRLEDRLQELGLDPEVSQLSQRELERLLAGVKEGRRGDSREVKVLREQCREEVDALARESVHKRGSLKRRMSKGMTSFRRQVFQSLQNLRKRQPTMDREGRGLRRKKKAPQPPRFVGRLDKDREGSAGARGGGNKGNEYEGTPRLGPPLPAPRLSVIRTRQQPEKEEEEVEEEAEDEEDEEYEEDSEDDSEEEDDQEDIEDVKARLQGQHYNGQTLTMVQGSLFSKDEDEEEDEEDKHDECEKEDVEEEDESTLKGISNKNQSQNELDEASEWDTEEGEENAEEVGDDEIENIDMEEIKLRRPKAGSKIADLTNIIEAQLHNRASRSVSCLVGQLEPKL